MTVLWTQLAMLRITWMYAWCPISSLHVNVVKLIPFSSIHYCWSFSETFLPSVSIVKLWCLKRLQLKNGTKFVLLWLRMSSVPMYRILFVVHEPVPSTRRLSPAQNSTIRYHLFQRARFAIRSKTPNPGYPISSGNEEKAFYWDRIHSLGNGSVKGRLLSHSSNWLLTEYRWQQIHQSRIESQPSTH